MSMPRNAPVGLERRFLATRIAPVRLEGDDEKPKIRGTAIVFYNGNPDTEYVLWDSPSEKIIERVAPTAVVRPLLEKQDVRGLFNHNPDHVLGRTTAGTLILSADTVGLHYEIEPGKTTIAKDLREMLDRKEVTGSSFGFWTRKQTWTQTQEDGGKITHVRLIEDMDLVDVSPVTFPAYTGTTAGYRSIHSDDVDRVLAEARQAAEAGRPGRTLSEFERIQRHALTR